MQLLGREVEPDEATIQVVNMAGEWLDWGSVMSEDDAHTAERFADDPQYRTVMRNKQDRTLWDIYYRGSWSIAYPLTPEARRSKYPNYIMKKVRQQLGLEEDDTSRDAEINSMSHNVVFAHCLIDEGIIGYEYMISSMIHDIYGVTLS